MLHEPAGNTGPDPAYAYKKRLGVVMFFVYSVIYTGFVLINLLNPTLMERIILAGTNLASVYGFGLIILAVALSLVYSVMCTRREQALETGGEKSE